MRISIIYTLIDPIDGSIKYIGQTVQPLKKRLLGHMWHYNNRRDKYGSITGDWIRSLIQMDLRPIIEEIDRGEFGFDADKREKYWIKFYRSQNIGLTNSSSGGHNGPISESQKAILSKIGFNSKMKVPIAQYDHNGNFLNDYNGIRYAGRLCNIKWKHILSCCTMKRKSAGGYQWRYKTKNYNSNVGSISIIKRNMPVVQKDLNDMIICSHLNIKTASKLLSMNAKSIERCCRGVYKTSGGFKWEYQV